MTTINAGNRAPDFSLKGLDGKEYELRELLVHKPVIAAFFKVSCPVCQFTFPFLERLYEKYGGDGAVFLGVSQDDARDTREFIRGFGVTFPIALDEKAKGYPASNAYGLTNVPTIFLIETDGTVKISSMGFVKADLEGIAGEMSQRHKLPAASLFLASESVPTNKPG